MMIVWRNIVLIAVEDYRLVQLPQRIVNLMYRNSMKCARGRKLA